ncbi:hypothetical protein [Streptomyces sp. SHP 1-2]|uniref:hypothetical protein n=1 Tax=Streptomyces sp. SHP 1-2 TaxID=2769489 RepID=UPI00223847E7|nr:hypothetical protein [Streptomyces sp. SHP 1-2]MCW5254691.1 hypothetical protein [Streptomyces sp. SHP 1-2]
MKTRLKVFSAGAGVAALAAAAFLVPLDTADDHGRPNVIIAQGKDGLPNRSPIDWVSYADQVAVVNVTSETEIPASTEEIAAGEGYISRRVTLDIDEVVWSRAGAPTPPSMLSLVVDGWAFKGDTRTPIALEQSSRLEPGHTYVLSLTQMADGSWSALGSQAALPYDSDVIGEGEYQGRIVTAAQFGVAVDAHDDPPEDGGHATRGAEVIPDSVAELTAGKSADDVETLLTTTEPDPLAEANFDLDPMARYEAVADVEEPVETFCSLSAPLAVSDNSQLTPGELGAILEKLAAEESGADATNLGVLAAYHSGDDTLATQADTVRPEVIASIEGQCGIEVGDLLPNSTATVE